MRVAVSHFVLAAVAEPNRGTHLLPHCAASDSTAPRHCAAMIQMALVFWRTGEADHPQWRPSSAWSACGSRGRSSAAQGREHQQGASASRDRRTRSSQAVQQPPGAAVAVLHRLTAITDTDPHIQGASGGRCHAEQFAGSANRQSQRNLGHGSDVFPDLIPAARSQGCPPPSLILLQLHPDPYSPTVRKAHCDRDQGSPG